MMKKIYCLLVAFAFATFSLMAQNVFQSTSDNQSGASSPFASPTVNISSPSGMSIGDANVSFRSAYTDDGNSVMNGPLADVENATFMAPPPPGADPDDQLPVGDVPFVFMAILAAGMLALSRRRVR